MESLNFTQFCESVGLCCDWDILDHGTLSPSGHCSRRAKQQQEKAMLQRIASNKEAHILYDAAILSASLVDPSGKVTRMGLIGEEQTRQQAKTTSRIAQIDTQIRMLESVGIGKKGTIRPSYQKQIDTCRQDRRSLIF